jgi:phosphoglycerate dehydrogenase-like enzyme
VVAHKQELALTSDQGLTKALGKGVLLVTWPGLALDDPDIVPQLRRAGLEIRLAPKTGRRTPAELRDLVADCVAAIASTDPFDHSVFEVAAKLRVIARVGVGTDSIDLRAATETGVVVTTTPGTNEETVADHTLAMMLALVRRLVDNDAAVRRGEWNRAGPLTGWDLHGKTVGLIGYGAIGRAVARRLQGFGTRIIVSDPAITHGDGVEVVTMDELLEAVDVASLHLPLSESTRGLIGRPELARMRPEAIIVNTSRGGLIEEGSLIEALEGGWLRGAALDVFDQEPPPSSRLFSLPNVVLTPHIAGISVESISRMLRAAAKSVVDVLEGRPGFGVVNPDALDPARDRRVR